MKSFLSEDYFVSTEKKKIIPVWNNWYERGVIKETKSFYSSPPSPIISLYTSALSFENTSITLNKIVT